MVELNLSDEQRALIKIIACSLKNEKFQLSDNIDLDAIYRESRLQAVAVQAYDTIDWNSVAESPIKEKWKAKAYAGLRNNLVIHNQHQYIHNILSKNGIRYCILKGSASARYYKMPHLRAMGDVDFLVHPEDIEKAGEVLKADGFNDWGIDHECHIVYSKDKMHTEMHFKPAGMPEGKAGEMMSEFLADIFDRAEVISVEGAKLAAPSHFHHGLIILMHMYHHLLSEGIGLRHLCDWAVFIDSFSEQEFVDTFYNKLSKCGLWRFTQIISLTVSRYFEIPYRAWMGEADDSIVSGVIEDVICGGNFGRKDRTRVTEGLMISNRGKDGVGKNSFAQMISTTNAIAKTSMPRLSKIPVIKHFAFVAMGVRYLFRVVTGKRKNMNFVDAISGAEDRKKLYAAFELFQIDDKLE